MAGVTADAAVAVVERIAAAPLPRHDRSELAGVLILLAGLRVPRAALAEALRRAHMIEDIWKESSFAGAIYDVALEEGREEGQREGRLEGMRQLARTALEGRFGALTDDVLGALNTADEAALIAIVAHITVESLEQIRARLGLS